MVTRSVPIQISGNACGNACGNALENHSEFVLKRVLKILALVYYANICFVNIENDFIMLLQ